MAGSVLLALALTPWRSPGSSEKLSRLQPHRGLPQPNSRAHVEIGKCSPGAGYLSAPAKLLIRLSMGSPPPEGKIKSDRTSQPFARYLGHSAGDDQHDV